MKILGIESSADETAAAVVEDGYKLLSNVISSSMQLHVQYGGIVPEISARSHLEVINAVIDHALADAKTKWDEIDAIAVTQGPGLGGCLLIGGLTARTLAIIKQKPLIAVNHVMAHPFASFVTDTTLPGYVLIKKQPEFPLLALIVSGGHSQLALFASATDYTLLGQTQDDAVGEAFDKVAKILGLPYPGGPSIALASKDGDPHAFKLPISNLDNPFDFSFSGLKTAVLRALQAHVGKSHDFPSFELKSLLKPSHVANMSASFQYTAIKTLVQATALAVKEYKPTTIVVAGGVAANQELRRQLSASIDQDVIFPDIKLCTDNAVMIATLGYQLYENGQAIADPYTLDIAPSLAM